MALVSGARWGDRVKYLRTDGLTSRTFVHIMDGHRLAIARDLKRYELPNSLRGLAWFGWAWNKPDSG